MRVALLHLPWSPPSVRIRWALGERGVPYRSAIYVPGSHHTVRIRLATGQSSVPVAWVDGRAVAGSTAIARAVDRVGTLGEPLFFDDPVRSAELDAWVAEADAMFDHARAAAAPSLARDREALRDAITPGPGWAHALFPLLWRVSGWDWARRYDLHHVDVEAARSRTRAAVLGLDARRGGRTYLVGDRFSYADIAVASYLGVVRPAPYLPLPAGLSRQYSALAEPGPWDPLFAWRDALLASRAPALAPAGAPGPEAG